MIIRIAAVNIDAQMLLMYWTLLLKYCDSKNESIKSREIPHIRVYSTVDFYDPSSSIEVRQLSKSLNRKKMLVLSCNNILSPYLKFCNIRRLCSLSPQTKRPVGSL